MTDELIEYDGVALGELTRRGEISPLELLIIRFSELKNLIPGLMQ